MASRRDELNAYTFAKRRLVASFLQPSPSGTEEGAPRPLRAIVPGAIAGVVIVAAFGAWGMFKPTAPKGWDDTAAHVIVANKSTTRYVVLGTKKNKQLYPVMNYASAKLLATKAEGNSDIVNVDEKLLDSGKIPHGPTLGIPYAPDRLPDPGEAAKQKRWAVCEQQSQGGRAVQKQSFVLAGADAKKVDDKHRLRGGDVLYVQASGGPSYMVDSTGRKYELTQDEALLSTLMGQGAKPQRVSKDWLDSLKEGSLIRYPRIGGGVNTQTRAPGFTGGERLGRVGTVLKTTESQQERYYIVLKDRVAPITNFTARVLLSSDELSVLGQGDEALSINRAQFHAGRSFAADKSFTWPKQEVAPVNAVMPGKGDRDTVCNVLRHVNTKTGGTTLSVWAGADYPQRIAAGTTSAYVTPGTGLLFRQFQGKEPTTGPVFLVTDTGLRYAVQGNNDSDTSESAIGKDDKKKTEETQESERLAQKLLGYGDTAPVPVPVSWSELLPTGPRLDTNSARQPQGS
ncbi:type VII secretion protein EccB [Streptomyces sp. NPDC050315]|uniref:type VII secretion protein EccB n=1 Tax=Streptomyces sp. NPDC050315 TaxID=3155039 RepID=UPI003448C153